MVTLPASSVEVVGRRSLKASGPLEMTTATWPRVSTLVGSSVLYTGSESFRAEMMSPAATVSLYS